MRREFLRRKAEERRASQQSAGSGATDAGGGPGGIDLNLTVSELDPSRGRLVLEFFTGHFLSLAAKSNDFRADGQCRMYVGLAQNLLRLLQELKLDGSASMGLQEELERLRQVSRATAQDYWNVNWGPTRSTTGSGAGGGGGAQKGTKGDDRRRASVGGGGPGGSFKEQTEPLPTVPVGNPSPILGTEEAAPADKEEATATATPPPKPKLKASAARDESARGEEDGEEADDGGENEEEGGADAAEVKVEVHAPPSEGRKASEPLYGYHTSFSLPRINLDHTPALLSPGSAKKPEVVPGDSHILEKSYL